MASAILKQKYWTLEEVIELEKTTDEIYELVDGNIYAMGTATDTHNRIAGNFYSKLNYQLKKCLPFVETMKVKINNTKGYNPDVVVDCAEKRINKCIISEPTLIVEVLSASTREIDLKEKLEAYKTLPTLQDYVVIEQNHRQVYWYSRHNDWQVQIILKGELFFESLDFSITLDEIYHRAFFDN